MSASQQHEILRSTLMKGNAISNSHMWQKQRQINALSLSVGRIVAPLLCFCVYKCCFLISHFELFWQVFGGKIASFFPGNGKKKKPYEFYYSKEMRFKRCTIDSEGEPSFHISSWFFGAYCASGIHIQTYQTSKEEKNDISEIGISHEGI